MADKKNGKKRKNEEIPSLEEELKRASEPDVKVKKRGITKLRAALYIFLFAVVLGVIGTGALIGYVYSLSLGLPSTEEFSRFKYSEPMVVYDAGGTVIAELGAERRYPLSIEEMPDYIYKAVVAVEDSRFYEHSGVDPWGIARAMIANIKAGRMVEGGSTLTQQLVKVLYLSPERKLKRKIKEAIIAYRLDRDLSKEKILELYLNQVNFGRGAYGIKAAAINYFDKDVKDLTIAEAAMVAGIPKGPSIYAPHLNLERSVKRRNHVLKRMRELDYISEEEYEAAKTETVKLAGSIPLKLRYAGYFMDFVHKFIEDELKIEDAQNMGLKVFTTLNLDYQIAAEKALMTNLVALGKREGYKGALGEILNVTFDDEDDDDGDLSSIVDNNTAESADAVKYIPLDNIVPSYLKDLGFKKAVVRDVNKNEAKIELADNSTGIIRLSDTKWAAKISGLELKDLSKALSVNNIIYVSKHKEKEGIYMLEQDPELEGAIISVNPQTGEIYAMAGGFSYNKSFFNRAVQAKRQVGSSIKPLVYSAAYESGYYPMSIFHDTPVIQEDRETKESWRPKNFDGQFIGEMTLKEALQKSNNAVTIKLAQKIGVKKIIRYARLFGLTEDMPDDLSVSIGSVSASPMEMAYAYSAFANQGMRPQKPYFVTRVADIDNKTLFEFQPPEHVKVLEQDSASLITENLVQVVEHGGAWRARNAIPRVMGGKTGTSNDSKDGWFAGFLPNLVTVTWVGYDDFKKMGAYAVGANTAQPIWIDYMKTVVDSVPYALFPKPVGIAFFKTDKETKEITDSIISDVSFEMYPIDSGGNARSLNYNK